MLQNKMYPALVTKIKESKLQIERSLYDDNQPWTPLLCKLEKDTGMNRFTLFVSGTVFVGIWLMIGYIAQLICNVVGLVYPGYVSMKAIESNNKEESALWLTYWVVFALFSVVEYFANFIVGFFPLYWFFKYIFLMWLMLPKCLNGSVYLYETFVRPYFIKHQQSIDNAFKEVKESAKKLLENATKHNLN